MDISSEVHVKIIICRIFFILQYGHFQKAHPA